MADYRQRWRGRDRHSGTDSLHTSASVHGQAQVENTAEVAQMYSCISGVKKLVLDQMSSLREVGTGLGGVA